MQLFSGQGGSKWYTILPYLYCNFFPLSNISAGSEQNSWLLRVRSITRCHLKLAVANAVVVDHGEYGAYLLSLKSLALIYRTFILFYIGNLEHNIFPVTRNCMTLTLQEQTLSQGLKLVKIRKTISVQWKRR